MKNSRTILTPEGTQAIEQGPRALPGAPQLRQPWLAVFPLLRDSDSLWSGRRAAIKPTVTALGGVLAFTLVIVLLQAGRGFFTTELAQHPDEAAHYVTGVMVFAWVWIVHVPRVHVGVSDQIAVFEAPAIAGIALMIAGWRYRSST